MESPKSWIKVLNVICNIYWTLVIEKPPYTWIILEIILKKILLSLLEDFWELDSLKIKSINQSGNQSIMCIQ